jgi:hypothetical protein
MAFEFYAEHDLSKSPEYQSVLHELRDEQGSQMLVIHMDVNASLFSPSVLKRMVAEFATLRSCTDAPIFAIEDNPDDDKWGRYVGHMGFEFSSRVDCTDGRSRRCFVSKKKNNNEHDQYEELLADLSAVGSPAAIPSAGVPAG